MAKWIVLFVLCTEPAAAQQLITPAAEINDLAARVMAPLVDKHVPMCESVTPERVPFYYGGSTPITLPQKISRCLDILPQNTFPSGNPYMDGYRGRLLHLSRLEVQDSIVRVSASYSVIRGKYPQHRNYSHGFRIEFRKRGGVWIETAKAEGVT